MKKILVLIAAFFMVASAAYAADWNFYGSARIHTMYISTETSPSNTSTSVYSEALSTNSRIGATVKASDSLKGQFEYGVSTAGAVSLRLLFGEWNFGGGSLVVGQDYTPVYNMYSSSIWNDDWAMRSFGASYSGREAQLKLKIGGFQIALLQPSVTYRTGVAGTVAGAGTTEVDVPSIEAAYRFAKDNWHVKLSGGYQSFNVFSGTTAYDIDSYVGAVGAGVSFGAVTLSGTMYAGQNAGNLITVSSSSLTTASGGYATFNAGTRNVTDMDCSGYLLVGSYKANDMFTFEAGVAGAKLEYDNATSGDDVLAYYLQSTITLAPGVIIVPEIGRVDYKEALQDQVTYVGAKWQISF